MANKFYSPGPERSPRVAALFDGIAARYDLINDLQSIGFHRLWKRRLINIANPRAGQVALDLCCGTGDVAAALAAKGMKVVGLDFSARMLEEARRRGRHEVQLLRGDALRIPFQDKSFDLVTVSYGLRNLADLEQGLREMMRVLRSGGRMVILDFGKPDQPLWRALYFGYLRRCVPWFGRLFFGDSETHGYILESLKNYPGQRGVEARLNQLNCADTRVINLWGGMMSINYAEKR